MKHYAGLDLSMEMTHICVVDAEGRKIGAACVDEHARGDRRGAGPLWSC